MDTKDLDTLLIEWDQLLGDMERRKQSISDILNLQKSFSDINEAISWINDIDISATSDNFGKDLASVQMLLREHEMVENTKTAIQDDNFNLKWRAYIEFRTILKIQPVQIFSELQEILCVDCPSRSTVERRAARFRSGDADVTDLPRAGRPVSATTSENIALI
ncbi:Transposase [Oopsacas minuta]|uniref:Transposase n=1 Tax=Oopsacas minuta TaxID=111878 RepID=A0AAV7KQ25_9METZ|nr:Transposase [Oopsacas minuta]